MVNVMLYTFPDYRSIITIEPMESTGDSYIPPLFPRKGLAKHTIGRYNFIETELI